MEDRAKENLARQERGRNRNGFGGPEPQDHSQEPRKHSTRVERKEVHNATAVGRLDTSRGTAPKEQKEEEKEIGAVARQGRATNAGRRDI